MPPFQEGMRIAWPVLCMRETAEERAALQAYLRDTCASLSLVTKLAQLPRRNGEDPVLTREVADAVKRRAEDVLQQAERKSALELEAAYAAAAEASAEAGQLAESVTARMTRLVDMAANGGLLCTTMARLKLETFRPAAVAVAPFLTLMQAHATTGSLENVRQSLSEGLRFLADKYSRTGECYSFGELELFRHYIVFVFAVGFPDDITRTLGDKILGEASTVLTNGAVSYEAQLRKDIADMRRQRHQMEGLAECAKALSKLIADYCVFFHIVAAVVDGMSKKFYDFGAAFHPHGGALYGAVRYPAARAILFARGYNDELRTKKGRSAITGRTIDVTLPASSPEALSSERVMPTATGGHSDALTTVLTLVIAPAAHMSTFVLLSTLASLPLSAALDVAVMVSEIQTLCQPYAPLVALVKAMGSGNLGRVWQCAKEVSAAFLELAEPLVSRDTRLALLAEVRRALCYQYAGSRSAVDLRAAAAHFELPGGAAAMQAELEPLIRSGRLPMSINTVDLILTQRVKPSLLDSQVVVEEALTTARVNAAEMELTLRRLAVQRELTHPTFDCVLLSAASDH